MSEWFSEELTGQWRQGLPIGPALLDKQSRFQHIQVFETREFGRMLVLDGKVQCTERDEFSYHEMLAHVPLLSHPDPKRVLVVGGGDGGTIREVLRHPSVTSATLVEIDEDVIATSRAWLPTMAAGLAPDPRLTIVTEDAAMAIGNLPPQDVILVDSSDPEGPSEVLFGQTFFESLRTALAPGGILGLQAGSPYFFDGQIRAARQKLEGLFQHVRPYLVSIPTYPGGTWCLIAASNDHDPKQFATDQLQERIQERALDLRYYTAEVHQASLALPRFMQ